MVVVFFLSFSLNLIPGLTDNGGEGRGRRSGDDSNDTRHIER